MVATSEDLPWHAPGTTSPERFARYARSPPTPPKVFTILEALSGTTLEHVGRRMPPDDGRRGRASPHATRTTAAVASKRKIADLESVHGITT